MTSRSAPKRLPRNRYLPYFLLTLLLYGSFSWLSRSGGRFTARTGGVRRQLRSNYSRVRGYFEWLEKHGYISEVTYGTGEVSGVLRGPVGLREGVR